MGCVASKQTVSVTPTVDYSGSILQSRLRKFSSSSRNQSSNSHHLDDGRDIREFNRSSSRGCRLVNLGPENLRKYIEGEHIAAGWPSWLSGVAAQAIHGWVPLKSESYQKLEQIGQGTYSSVYKARDLNTGQIVALKKVRFDNLDPESVRFMAREIHILRQLNHPNIIKLEGLIASNLSSTIYLVFEYMEHDLTGLSTCPDISFSESQVKCYMHQLLSGLDYCHSHGIMHRDIKGSNLLLNNEGCLKIADFGLANYSHPCPKQPLTSRVVTLWYRPPELLLGATDYGTSVDLWSVGCVFAELLLGKPILQGRTEIEQLHKIFKLCGSPPEDFWKKSKLPHASMLRPEHPYVGSLRVTCKGFSESSVKLIETLLSVDPCKRGTASAAIKSEYFMAEPYACDPSTLPKYPPNKEIDAKNREEAHRKKVSVCSYISEETRQFSKDHRKSREASSFSRLAARESFLANCQGVHIQQAECQDDTNARSSKCRNVQASKAPEDASHVKHGSLGDIPFSGPLVPSSSGFSWMRKRRDVNPALKAYTRSTSKGQIRAQDMSNSGQKSSSNIRSYMETEEHEHSGLHKCSSIKHQQNFEEAWQSLYQQDHIPNEDYINDGEMIEFSGPLMSQSSKIDKILQRNERFVRQAVRRSWFRRGKDQRK